MNFLIDHNLKGQAALLLGTIAAEGWLKFVPLRFVTFEEVGLSSSSSDRIVWEFAQTHKMILITANRNMKGVDSLEQMIRQYNTARSFPIVTIGSKERLDERSYRERCASRLIEIILDLKNYMGVGRLYIP